MENINMQSSLTSKGLNNSLKPINTNQQRAQDQDVIKKKREGEHLTISEEKLVEMIEKANKILLKPPTELRFSIEEQTKQISIKIVNTENQEIIMEIPPKKLMGVMAKMWEMVGIFVDEKA